MHDNITPIILTYNESPNIERTLTALTWAKNIIVVDSFSDDDTQTLCENFTNVTFIQRQFDQHAKQWNFALEQDIKTDWVLALDADHIISNELIDELKTLQPARSTCGFWVEFIYKINSQVLRGSLYPALVALYRKDSAHYLQDGHTQRVQVSGSLQKLRHKTYHDDRKPMTRWLTSQWFYAKQEAQKLNSSSWSSLSNQDRIRKIPGLSPIIIVPFTLFIKGLIFNGKAGWLYTLQRLLAELLLQYALLISTTHDNKK